MLDFKQIKNAETNVVKANVILTRLNTLDISAIENDLEEM